MKLLKQLTVLFALISVPVMGQSHVEAKALLEKVKDKLTALTDQSLSFTNIIEIPTGNPNQPMMTRQNSGTLTAVGMNYKVTLPGQEVIINGNMAYIISPDDEEIDVRDLGDGDVGFTPSRLIERFENGSSFAMAGRETVDGKTIQYVKVRPNGSEEIRDIVIGVDTRTNLMYSYTEYGTNDVVTKYVINSYRVNTGVSASEVTFNRSNYSGWRINEPRSRR